MVAPIAAIRPKSRVYASLPSWLLSAGGVAPTLDIDFVNDRAWSNSALVSISALLSCTRASTGYYLKADGTLQNFSSNTLRYGTNGLLVEEARTNVLKQSQTFDNASWGKGNVTVSADAAVAPDGTTTADLYYPNSNGSLRTIYQLDGTGKVLSVYAKMSGVRWLYFMNVSDSAGAVWFDLQNGAVGTVAGGYTASIQALANGWYRCIVINASAFAYFDAGLADADNSTTITKSGTNGIYLWGAQSENAAFATSYIPTTSSGATRAADSVTLNSVGSYLVASAGSAYLQTGTILGGSNVTNPNLLPINISAGTLLYAHNSSGATASIDAYNGSALLDGPDISMATLGSAAQKMAIAWATSRRAVSLNGGAAITDANGIGTVSELGIGKASGFATANGTFLRVALWSSQISDGNLAALTA